MSKPLTAELGRLPVTARQGLRRAQHRGMNPQPADTYSGILQTSKLSEHFRPAPPDCG
jgi:hypothetical protein